MSKVIILGAGGHGWKSLAQFVQNTDAIVKICYIPADWGGFTGLFGRVLEFQDNNLKLHNKVLPIFSFGDTNKLVDYFLQKKYKIDLNTRFDFVDSVENLVPVLQNMCDLMELESREFIAYFTELYKQIQQYLILFPDEIQKGCVGNFWHQFLIYKFGSMELISAFYQNKEIFPNNLQIYFSHLERPILSAKDSLGNLISGEDKIDNHKLTLDPKSIQVSGKINPKLLKDLASSDFVILPHGSICNWLPLINCPAVTSILETKQVFSLMNLFYLPNEFEYFEYMRHLWNLGVSPIVIGPKIKHLVFDTKILNKYKKQQKRLNIVQNLNHNTFFGSLEIITEVDGKIEGIKHCPDSVAKTLKMFIN